MDWHVPLIIGETAALVVLVLAFGGTRFRARFFTEQALEYRAAVGFARLQVQASVAARFLRAWQEGNLDRLDANLFQEWMTFRSKFLLNLRIEP